MRAFLGRSFGPYAHRRVWLESAYLLLNLPMGIALFTVVVTLLSLGAGLAVTFVGLPLLGATIVGGRAVAAVERVRVRALLDEPFAPHPSMAWETGLWARAKQMITDRPGWKGLAYAMLMLPWGIFTFTATVVLWSTAFSMASVPFWGWAGDPPPPFTLGTTRFEIEGWSLFAWTLVSGVVGLLLVALLPRLIHLLAGANLALARLLLAPDEATRLAMRVSELQVSRDASVESSAGELRRIERDLHDGAQQRLVSLAMNLGMAKERLRDSDDEHARELVGAAHDDAKQAIAELRDLVRGIHPAVLTDRGLDAAVSALVARCPVPVHLHTELPRRLPQSLEATAYFVVAEALTNVAKHSHARTATVRLVERDESLLVEVYDDGVGGADESAGSGLRGLRDRVAGVEGRLRIASPFGGPTVLSVELPCAL